MGKIIGIDLGTTNSCVAVLDGSDVVVVHNQEGGRTTPSMVSWNKAGEPVVGAPAKRQMVTNPENTVYGVKRLLGRRFDSTEIQGLRKTTPFEITESHNGDAWINIQGNAISPQEIAAMILKKKKFVAEDYLGEAVEEAIITVPAYFDDMQRQATRDAGVIAGLTVHSILNEPTAAALAFGLAQQKDQRIAVFDLGGGTFDVSILTIAGGVFEVLATGGDNMLGGDDFDVLIIKNLIVAFKHEHDIDLSDDPVALQRLKEAAERAKIELSSALTTDINLPFLAVGEMGPVHLQREFKRAEIESLFKPLLERLLEPCTRALEHARVGASDIDQVVLVGGMTRMPAVQERVERIFGRPPSKGVNPDEIVAVGAATQSGIVAGELEEAILLDVTPHAMGIRVAGDKMSVLIEPNTSIPTSALKVFSTTEDNQAFVSIEVFQGQSENAGENRQLGRFTLGDLPERPAGQVRVQVRFTVDANGFLHVSASDMATGRDASVTLQATGGLSKAELDELKKKSTVNS